MIKAVKLREETGAVTVVVTAALTALLLSIAIIIDMGLLYQERRQLQTATDAAALAAAMDLAEGKSVPEAESNAIAYLCNNANVLPSYVRIDYPGADRVKVSARTERSMFFSGVVKQSSSPVRASSTAAMGAANGVSKLVPFIVPLHKVREYQGEGQAGVFEFGEDRPLNQNGQEENSQKGFFWLCDFDGGSGGVPNYDAWIRQGFPEYVYAGDIANGTGVKASLKDAISWRKGFDSSVVVPVYNYTEGSGSGGSYNVVGFAEFVITGFNLNGNPKTITGYFTDGTIVSGVPGSAPHAYFGVDTVWLVD